MVLLGPSFLRPVSSPVLSHIVLSTKDKHSLGSRELSVEFLDYSAA